MIRSAPTPSPAAPSNLPDPREAITHFQQHDEREADRAPLSLHLVRRIFAYTRPHAIKRNSLFVCRGAIKTGQHP